MPTFCRHNRFIERCPICAKTLPGGAPADNPPRARAPGAARGGHAARRRAPRAEGVRVLHEQRAADDGFHSELVPGLRASADALRLAEEIAFSNGRLAGLAAQPPGLYGEVRSLAAHDVERAIWSCFMIAYLCPLEGEGDPFAGIRAALEGPVLEPPELEGVPLGPRSSHDASRGSQAVSAYCGWAARAGGQRAALEGDTGWDPERRFARAFERLALGGFARTGRYEMLVLLGRLGVFEMRADSLHFSGAGAASDGHRALLAAKRVFGIGDPLLLERRAGALAQEAQVPVEALDLALWNWGAPERATLGFPAETTDADALERAAAALGV